MAGPFDGLQAYQRQAQQGNNMGLAPDWQQMMMQYLQPPSKLDRLAQMLGTVGGYMTAAGANSFDPGQSGRIMGQMPQALAQNQVSYQDQMRQLAMFGMQAERLKADEEERKRRGKREDRRLSIEESQFAAQQGMAEARAALAGMDPSDPNYAATARTAFPDKFGSAVFRDPKAPKTVKTGDGVYALNPDGTLGSRLGDLPPAGGNVTVNNFPDLQALDPSKSYRDPETGEVIRPKGATTPAEDLTRTLTPAEMAVDAAYAKEYTELIAGGGLADLQKNVGQLREVKQRLESGKVDLTGGISGYMPTWMRAPFDPESVAAQETVEEVVQRNLKSILGAQFTEEEGKRLIDRAYNPRLEEPENAKRIGRLLTAMDSALEAKQAAAAYYEANGTLKGFQGSTQFDIEYFERAIEGTSGATRAGPRDEDDIRRKSTEELWRHLKDLE